MTPEDSKLEVAIVGGGIAGISLAIGLVRRNVKCKLYERAHSFREIGAGIGFSPNAERAMTMLDPKMHAAFRRVATPNSQTGDPEQTTDFFQWADGYTHDGKGEDIRKTENAMFFKLYVGKRGFEGCHRADFLDEMVQLIPPGHVEFSKHLDTIVDRGDDKKLLLKFHDGSTAEADVAIGCDGIRSRVRQLVLGEDNPAAHPHYSHKFALRGLIPMERAKQVLGDAKASVRWLYVGQDAHCLTYPVAMGSLMNIAAFASDANEWADPTRSTLPADKKEATKAFANFNPTVRAVMDLLPEKLDKWAIFDMFDHPATTYVKGRVCVAGDAAHGCGPHHGAGGGFCIEDALVLATVMEMVDAKRGHSKGGRAEAVRAGLAAYEAVRFERCQWLVETSRQTGEMFEWQYPAMGPDAETFGREMKWRSHKIWDYDLDKMVSEVEEKYAQLAAGVSV